jgi:hypothetical protein
MCRIHARHAPAEKTDWSIKAEVVSLFGYSSGRYCSASYSSYYSPFLTIAPQSHPTNQHQ